MQRTSTASNQMWSGPKNFGTPVSRVMTFVNIFAAQFLELNVYEGLND
jgi:hypothetical protein